jgi:hypothetical protein
LPEGAGKLEPQMIKIDHFLPQFERCYDNRGVLDGDLFWPVVPTRSIPWLEAMMGAPIHYFHDHGAVSIFAEPSAGGFERFAPATSLSSNPWFRKLIEFIAALARLSTGRFPLAGSHTRGPWDILSAVRGMSNVLEGLYACPHTLSRLAEQCADLWIAVTSKLAEIVPAWEGGYVGVFGVWAPGFSAMPQNDMSVSVSPRMYRELLAPADLRTVRACGYPMFHTHSAGYHHLEAVVELLGGRGSLNVVVDETGPALEVLIPVLRKAQQKPIPLHLFCTNSQLVEQLSAALSPKGLAISYAE